jgi:hypothetical protein
MEDARNGTAHFARNMPAMVLFGLITALAARSQLKVETS